jgi:hypothetical protein
MEVPMSDRPLGIAFVPVLLLGLASCAPGPVAGSQGRPYTPEQAISAQGNKVAVAGVASVSDANGMPGTFIRLTAPDTEVPFVGYISIDNERQFPNPGQLQGHTIEITGVVETRGTIPMIMLTSPDQVRVLR